MWLALVRSEHAFWCALLQGLLRRYFCSGIGCFLLFYVVFCCRVLFFGVFVSGFCFYGLLLTKIVI